MNVFILDCSSLNKLVESLCVFSNFLPKWSQWTEVCGAVWQLSCLLCASLHVCHFHSSTLMLMVPADGSHLV